LLDSKGDSDATPSRADRPAETFNADLDDEIPF
jgi:hypothetical protein